MSLYDEQIELENYYSHRSVLDSIQRNKEAMDKGRGADTGIGKRVLAKAYDVALEHIRNVYKPVRGGVGAKYHNLIIRVEPEIATIAALRFMFQVCVRTKTMPLQEVLRGIGQIMETEAIVAKLEQLNPVYLEKTDTYLNNSGTTSINHRNRTFKTAAEHLNMNLDSWTNEERIAVGRLICAAIWETGLFAWEDMQAPENARASLQVLKPSAELELHLTEAVEASRDVVRYPPMLVPPRPWVSAFDGGYLTPWFQQRAAMVSMRAPKKIRNWVAENLTGGKAEVLKTAMNKAQSVPYRVNTRVLDVLSRAVAIGDGRMGLARTAPEKEPTFPFLCKDTWDKSLATPEELDDFKIWKSEMHGWYTRETARIGQNIGVVTKMRLLQEYSKYKELYFPTFADYRGRVYFRGSLQPQGADSVKGCLEFAEGKELGEVGMFWLKVHIANCAGYDKKLPELKVKWFHDNLEMLTDFYENPLDVTPPDKDNAFSLYAGLCEYFDAMKLPDPLKFVSHIPVAQDATCSGLQHCSAMLRDPIGAKYTNLTYDGADEKADIYKKVGEFADTNKVWYEKDVVIHEYWKGIPIPRGMAKRPVMTYVYGSTLKSCMTYVTDYMIEEGLKEIRDDQGKIAYNHMKLSVPIAKALRAGVVDTVPAAEKGMQFLKDVVKASEEPVRWITPVGMPVVNWAEERETRKVQLRSMGRASALFSFRTGEYARVKAGNGIAPNFVHSLDGAHLCMTLANTAISILPIHDSFATHACDVPEMNRVLREQFVALYQTDVLAALASQIIIREGHDLVVPPKGSLNLEDVLSSPFMFC